MGHPRALSCPWASHGFQPVACNTSIHGHSYCPGPCCTVQNAPGAYKLVWEGAGLPLVILLLLGRPVALCMAFRYVIWYPRCMQGSLGGAQVCCMGLGDHWGSWYLSILFLNPLGGKNIQHINSSQW